VGAQPTRYARLHMKRADMGKAPRMTIVLMAALVLTGWTVLSIPLGVLVGRWLSASAI